MDKRQYLLLKGLGYVLVVFMILAVVITKELEDLGIIIGIGLLAFFSYLAYASFKKIKNTRSEDRVYAPAMDATTAEKIAYYKRILLMGAPAFLILSIWMYVDLNELETGAVESVSIWEPVAFIYDNMGYWYAVLATPLLGLITIFMLLRKIHVLKRIKEE